MAKTTKLNLPLVDNTMTADVPRDLNALANAIDTAVETPAGAQAKVDAVLITSKSYSDSKASVAENNAKVASVQKETINIAQGTDLNSIRSNGFYDGNGIVNAPNSGWFYFLVQEHSANGNSWRTQTATNFDSGRRYLRTLVNGAWTPWKRTLNEDDYTSLFQYANDGKITIANAVSGKGVTASPSDTFATLATKISQIQTGGRKAFNYSKSRPTSAGTRVYEIVDYLPDGMTFGLFIQGYSYITNGGSTNKSYVTPVLIDDANTTFYIGSYGGFEVNTSTYLSFDMLGKKVTNDYSGPGAGSGVRTVNFPENFNLKGKIRLGFYVYADVEVTMSMSIKGDLVYF